MHLWWGVAESFQLPISKRKRDLNKTNRFKENKTVPAKLSRDRETKGKQFWSIDALQMRIPAENDSDLQTNLGSFVL